MIVPQSTYFACFSQHPVKNAVFCGFIKVFDIGTTTAILGSPQVRLASK
jgi:hypothetical protein